MKILKSSTLSIWPKLPVKVNREQNKQKKKKEGIQSINKYLFSFSFLSSLLAPKNLELLGLVFSVAFFYFSGYPITKTCIKLVTIKPTA